MLTNQRTKRPGHLLLLRGAPGAGKTSVGIALQRLRPELQVIEIDDLKRAAYGSAGTCVPTVDYPKAGTLARQHLEQGFDTVVIEPLADRWHLRSVIAAAGRFLKSSDVSVVWLECSLVTAIERKRGRLEPQFVAWQHSCVASRDRPRGESVIDTERYNVNEVAELVVRLLPEKTVPEVGN
jgi:chloramphenicol 3-O-phosphotransferase